MRGSPVGWRGRLRRADLSVLRDPTRASGRLTRRSVVPPIGCSDRGIATGVTLGIKPDGGRAQVANFPGVTPRFKI
jgi:hypothetical protein